MTDEKTMGLTAVIKGGIMTNKQKTELRILAKQGYSFSEIKRIVECADSTIRSYIKTFQKSRNKKRGEKCKKKESKF